MIHDLARSTVANTELNGFHETAVTAAALRINKPPGLGRWENNVFHFDANDYTHLRIKQKSCHLEISFEKWYCFFFTWCLKMKWIWKRIEPTTIMKWNVGDHKLSKLFRKSVIRNEFAKWITKLIEYECCWIGFLFQLKCEREKKVIEFPLIHFPFNRETLRKKADSLWKKRNLNAHQIDFFWFDKRVTHNEIGLCFWYVF